jgi:regulator of protease activity HflC (stomatin/prohibitin superfamily)
MRNRQAMRMMQHYAVLGGSETTGRSLRRGRRVTVNEWERGLLFHHGRLEADLPPGAHRRWASGYTLRAVDLRPWVVLVPVQEIPTADGVTVKVTVAGQARVTDASVYVTATRNADEALYLAIQVALREVVATTSLDDLLTGRGGIGAQLLDRVRGVDDLGIGIDQLELKDIVLPGELKRAQTELLVARAKSASDLERARGETAALRSLANAARLAADNPALVQLRLLQQIEASTGHTVIIGTPPFGAAPPPRQTPPAAHEEPTV